MEKPNALNTYDPESLLPENRNALLRSQHVSRPGNSPAADEVLMSRVRARLLETDYFDEARVHVTIAAGRVTLRGEVSDLFMKHAADDVLANCEGVEGWENQLVVKGEA